MEILPERVFPKTFFEFHVETTPGKKQLFWVQDATEEYFEDVVENFVNGFLKDEPISKHMNGRSDEVSMQETRYFYNELLNEQLSLVCLTKTESGLIKLAGFNVLASFAVGEKIEGNFNGWFINFMIKLFSFLDAQKDAFSEFHCTKCLKAFGLYVLPEFRSNNIGAKILQARTGLGKDLGFKLTTTAFTSFISQKQAYKAGFNDYVEFDYLALGASHPEFQIPNIEKHTKSLKLMYKLI